MKDIRSNSSTNFELLKEDIRKAIEENPDEISEDINNDLFITREKDIKYTFTYLASNLCNKESDTLSLNGNPNIEIIVFKGSSDKEASIRARIKEDTEIKYYAKLELETNDIWEVRKNEIKDIYSNIILEELCKLNLWIKEKELIVDKELIFHLTLFEIDDKIKETKKYYKSLLLEMLKNNYLENKPWCLDNFDDEDLEEENMNIK